MILIKRLIILLFPLFVGVLIYFIYREPTFRFRRWINADEQLKFIDNLYKPNLPDWVIYNLPDGLWMISLTYSILWLLNFKIINKFDLMLVLVPFFIALLTECAQYYNVLHGTFDILDILFYSIGLTLPIIITLKKEK